MVDTVYVGVNLLRHVIVFSKQSMTKIYPVLIPGWAKGSDSTKVDKID